MMMIFARKRNLFSLSSVVVLMGGLVFVTIPKARAQMGGSPAGQMGGMQGGMGGRPAMPGNNTGLNGPMGPQNTLEANVEQNFLNRMKSDSMAETEFSKLALKNSSNQDIKKMAQQTIMDNHRMDGAMTGALPNGSFPVGGRLSSQAHKAIKSMKKMTGTQFDQMYLSQMDGYVKNDQKILSDSSTAVNSPDLRALMSQIRTLADNRVQQLQQVAQSENFKLP